MVNRFFHAFLRKLPLSLAGQCILCGANNHRNCTTNALRLDRRNLDLCLACENDLPSINHGCQHCALPLAVKSARDCGQCLRSPPPFKRTIAAWPYSPPIAQLISGFKYNRHYSYGQSLGKVLASKLASTYKHNNIPQLIVPTPLHWWRQLQRGFNQSEQLASCLSSQLQVPISRAVKRIKPTPPQQTLNAQQRRHNLQGVFTVTRPVRGKRLALVDDVMTTGATAAEISRCLLSAGALEVHVWCLARTPL